MMKLFFFLFAFYFFPNCNLFSQDNPVIPDLGSAYKYLTSHVDSSSGQFFILLDSLPENIYYPHNIIWEDDKWKLQIIFEENFSAGRLIPAITKNGLLFFINPALTENKFLIFANEKWTYSDLPPQN